MAKSTPIHWGAVVAGGFLAELAIAAIVFPVLHLFGQRAFIMSIPTASAMMPFIFAVWVGSRVESRSLLHGALLGIIAVLIYVGVTRDQPEPLLYKVANVLKVVGGAIGGAVAPRRKPPAGIDLQSD